MATHSISDVLHGIVRFRRDNVTTAEFLLKPTITVANGDLINIVEEYTSNSGTNSKTVFHGRITNVDYSKTQYVSAIDVADELNQSRPTGDYSGYTEVVLGRIVNDAITANELNNVLCTETTGDITLLPDSDIDVKDWTTAPLFSKINDTNDATYITNGVGYFQHIEIGLDDHSLSSNYNYWIYKISMTVRARRNAGSGQHISYRLYDGDDILIGAESDNLTGGFVNYTDTWEDLEYTQDDINGFYITLNGSVPTEVDVSEVSVKVYYKYYPNLAKCTVKAGYTLGGNKTIKEVLKTLSLVELKTWYIDPDFQIHFTAGDVVSGESLVVADKAKNIVGERQVISYDKVILYGAYSGGAQITKTVGAGDIIWRDNYLNINVQADLDALAAQILSEQGANTIKTKLKRRDATDGVYQVSETFAIGAGVEIKFSGSDRYIPNNTTYIINKIDYVISNGVYNYLDIEIIDGLLFSTPKDDTLGIIKDGTIENSLGISQVAGGESVGQSNTGSNVGTDGVGVYDAKSGVTLQFRNIAPASSAITVTLNSKDIDIDLSLLGLEDLSDPGADRIYFWDDGAGKTDWLIANTGLEISGLNLNCTITQYTDALAVTALGTADNYLKNDAAGSTTGDLTVPNLICVGNVDGVDISVFNATMREQSITFPGAPVEGDFHYDEDDDSLYRYNAEAEAWIEVGVGGGKGEADIDKTRTILMEMVPDNGATISTYGILINAQNEGWAATIKLPSNIDASKDVKIIYTWKQDVAGDYYRSRWCRAIKTDGSEAESWNIVNGGNFTENVPTGGRVYTNTYTISAANIDSGDIITFLIRNQAGEGQVVYYYSTILEYEVL